MLTRIFGVFLLFLLVLRNQQVIQRTETNLTIHLKLFVYAHNLYEIEQIVLPFAQPSSAALTTHTHTRLYTKSHESRVLKRKYAHILIFDLQNHSRGQVKRALSVYVTERIPNGAPGPMYDIVHHWRYCNDFDLVPSKQHGGYVPEKRQIRPHMFVFT